MHLLGPFEALYSCSLSVLPLWGVRVIFRFSPTHMFSNTDTPSAAYCDKIRVGDEVTRLGEGYEVRVRIMRIR